MIVAKHINFYAQIETFLFKTPEISAINCACIHERYLDVKESDTTHKL